jgi:Ca2+-binding EF-hand superfamily protein
MVGSVIVNSGISKEVITFPEKSLQADRKYIAKWFSSQSAMATLLAKAEFTVSRAQQPKTRPKVLISSAQRKVLAKVFSDLDKDLDGKITFFELKEYLLSHRVSVSDSDVKTLMRNADINGDGGVDFKEFVRVLKESESGGWFLIRNMLPLVTTGGVKRTLSEEPERLTTAERKVFSKYFADIDKNNDGEINYFELKDFMVSIGFHVTEADIKGMMREADTSGDGRIDFTEFASICKKAADYKSNSSWRLAQARIGHEISREKRFRA